MSVLSPPADAACMGQPRGGPGAILIIQTVNLTPTPCQTVVVSREALASNDHIAAAVTMIVWKALLSGSPTCAAGEVVASSSGELAFGPCC